MLRQIIINIKQPDILEALIKRFKKQMYIYNLNVINKLDFELDNFQLFLINYN